MGGILDLIRVLLMIPSMIAFFAFFLVFPPILTFYFMLKQASEKNNSTALYSTILFHVCWLVTFLLYKKQEFYNAIDAAPIITGIGLIFLYLYFSSFSKNNKEIIIDSKEHPEMMIPVEERTRLCPYCNKKNKLQNKFCVGCGKKIIF